jgi:hypothetical protein
MAKSSDNTDSSGTMRQSARSPKEITRSEQLRAETKSLVATSTNLCEPAATFVRSIQSTTLPVRQRAR